MTDRRIRIVFIFALATGVVLTDNTLAQQNISQSADAGLPRADQEILERQKLRDEAVALYEQGKWREAFEAFKKADNKFHAPMYVLYMARCKEKLKDTFEAYTLYKRIIDEPSLSNSAKPNHVRAQQDAKGAAEKEIEKLYPTLLIVVTNLYMRKYQIAVDYVPQLSIKEPIKLEPGRHQVSVELDESQIFTYTIHLPVAEQRTFPLMLPPKSASVSNLQSAGEPQKPAYSLVGPAVFMGVGGAVMVGGIVTSIYASNAWEDCSLRSCAADQEQARKLDSGGAAAAVAGAAILIVGGIWLGLALDHKPRAPKNVKYLYAAPPASPSLLLKDISSVKQCRLDESR